MGGGSILSALPIGLILFLGMYLGMKRRKMGFEGARARFPAVAERLGLTHVPPSNDQSIGKLLGEIDGFSVVVDPDERMRIAIEFPVEVPILLRSYEKTRLAPGGMERLDTGRSRIDGMFKERYAAPELADAIYDDPKAFEAVLEPFRTSWWPRLKDFVVTSEGAHCVFDFGKPPHLPPSLVEGVVPDLIALGRLLVGAARRASDAKHDPVASDGLDEPS